MKLKRTAAALLSAAMFCTALPAFPAVYAAEEQIPSWVPQTFEDAVKFDNTYGETHAADGVYCIVDRLDSQLGPECSEQCSGSSAERIYQSTLRYEPIDGMPDLSQMPAEERAEWEQRLQQQGDEEDYNKNVYYFVSVWKPKLADNYEIIRQYSFREGGTVSDQQLYTFSVADDVLHVVETGWRAVLPDCKTEYDAFIKEHGYFYAAEDYVILASDGNSSTGEKLNMTVTLGEKQIDPLYTTSCEPQKMVPNPPGSSEYYAKYFRITEPGSITARITKRQSDGSSRGKSKEYRAAKNTAGRIYLYEDSKEQQLLPYWIPQDYAEAVSFHNSFGNSRAADGVICIVTRHDGAKIDSSNWGCVPIVGSAPGDCTRVLDEYYEPQEYYMRDGMRYESLDSWASYPDGSYHCYHVTVWKPVAAGEFVLYETSLTAAENPKDEDVFRFAIADDLSVSETDWRGYVPDCTNEYSSFIRSAGGEYGLGKNYWTSCNADGRGDYLVITARIEEGILLSVMEAEATLEGEKISLTRVDCHQWFDGPEPTDVRGSFALYSKITKPGTIKVKITQNKTAFVTEQTLAAIRRNDGSIFVMRLPDDKVPDWAPKNFEQASQFPLYEAVGGKLVLCIPYTVSDDFDYVLDDPGMAGGSANHKLLSTERYTEGNRGYLVEVFNVLSEGNFGMKWLRVPKEGKSVTQERLYTLTFEADETLTARETALGSLFPADYDSASEAEPIVVKDGFLICTGYGSGSTGFQAIVEIDGSAIADPVTSRSNSLKYTPTRLDGGMPSGGTTYKSFAYKPVQEGILRVKVVSGRTFNRSEDIVLGTKYFKVNADLSLTEITFTEGDLTGDGKMTTADLVVLSKYLSGAGTLSEKQFYAADMKNDGRINAADMSVMKQKLLAAKA